MKKMGWSSHYRFNVIVSDINGVKLIAKAGLNVETPTFDSTSDTIDGVSVNGRTVDITKNAEFTLFAVDSCNNVTEIPLVADNLGEAEIQTGAMIVYTSADSVLQICGNEETFDQFGWNSCP